MEMSKDKFFDLIKNLDQEQFKKVFNYTLKINSENVIKESTQKKEIDKTTPKYKIVLVLINKILQNIGKNQIDDLIQFQNINRLDIIKNCNLITLNEMEKEIFQIFEKKKCGYYRKTDSIVLNCLRSMIKELGLEFKIKKISKTNKCKIETHYLYSINKKTI
jgi:hypothetical protein